MSSIFPSSQDGGVIVRNPNTGAQISQPNTDNVDFPAQLNINCDFTALPSLCGSRVAPAQINAIVSELINFYMAMCPDREWDCTELDNLASGFECFVENLVSEGLGSVSCSVQMGQAQDEAQAYILYCDGNTLKRWSVHDEGGLIEFIYTMMCDVPNDSNITDGDELLFCRAGQIRKGSYTYINYYTGPWLQNRTYTTKNMVQKDGKLYSPNANIPAGTPFVIGTTNQTWREVSQTVIPTYDPANDYSEDTVILNYDDGKYYAANSDIPAGTPFNVGTTGLTWRQIDPFATSILNWSNAKAYKKFNVVVYQGLILRALKDNPGGVTNSSDWEVIGGERNLYRGEWSQGATYLFNDLVMRQLNGGSWKLYKANGNIPAQTDWTVGSGPNTWTEVSPSLGIEFQYDMAYSKYTVVSWLGVLYYANDDIPANYSNSPPNNMGTSGKTWTQMYNIYQIQAYNQAKAYKTGELFLYRRSDLDQNYSIFYAPGGPAQPFNRNTFGELAGRSIFRGDWELSSYYRRGDLVLRSGITEPYGTFFEANSDMQTGTPWSVGTGTNQFKKLAAGGGGSSGPGGTVYGFKVYTPGQAYTAGEFVLTAFGLYQARTNIPNAQNPFIDDDVLWTPYNSGRRPFITMSASFNTAVTNHRNATIRFDFAGPKQYVMVSNILNEGDTVSGYSVNGQLTVAGASDVEIWTPDGGALRNKNYASFTLKCIRRGGGGIHSQYLLAGDLQALP